jgi:ribosome-associated protein
MSENYLEIQLDQQPIELYKLLKIADLVAGGGEAKVVISEGYVLLNGEVAYQKRRKVYHNDIVEFNGETLQMIVNENLDDEFSAEVEKEKEIQSKNTAKSPPKKEKTPKPDKQSAAIFNDESAVKKGKRRPISF